MTSEGEASGRKSDRLPLDMTRNGLEVEVCLQVLLFKDLVGKLSSCDLLDKRDSSGRESWLVSRHANIITEVKAERRRSTKKESWRELRLS
jgi:hypothetical protein